MKENAPYHPPGRHEEPDVTIRRAERTDVAVLARFHVDAHPRAFLPLLGERFLRHLYRALVEDDAAVAFVAEEDGEVVGFATGVVSVPAFYRRFYRRHGPAAVLGAMPRLVRPRVMRRIYETARYPQRAAPSLPDAEFTTLAVAPGIRSKGLGGRLSEEVIRGLAAMGVEAVRGTVNATNQPMNRMMRRISFQRVGETVIHDGEPSIVYVIRCGPEGLGEDRP